MGDLDNFLESLKRDWVRADEVLAANNRTHSGSKDTTADTTATWQRWRSELVAILKHYEKLDDAHRP